MKLVKRSAILRIMSALGVDLYVYAGFLTLRALLFGTHGGASALLAYLLTAVFGFTAGRLLLGRSPAFLSAISGCRFVKFIAFMLNIKSSVKFTASFTAWFLIILPVIAPFLLYGGMGAHRLLFELVPVVAAYVIALKQSRLQASQIMSKASVYSGFFILVLSLELTNISAIYFTSIEYLKPWLYAVSYYFIFVFLVVRNQEDIDSNIFDKKHIEKSILPKNLRSFNTASVCVVFAVILLLFNLKAVVLAFFHLIKQLSVLMLKFILWLIQTIFPLSGDEQGDTGSAGGGLFGFGSQPISPVRNFIFNIIRSFVLYYIIYRLALAVVRTAPKVFRRLAAMLRKLLSLERGDKADSVSDYSDETETVLPERKQKPGNNAHRRIRPGRRGLRQIKDPVLKVRYMFSDILRLLPSAGVNPEKSDTPTELAQKTGLYGKISEGLSPFAAIYNQVRYGERIPDQKMLDAAERNYSIALDAIEHKN